MILPDTDILIDVQRGFAPAVAWFASLEDLPIVPGLVVMELVQGARDARQVREVERLVRPFTVAWPTGVDCVRALSVFTAHHQATGPGFLDSSIASRAIGLSASLCTFNDKHYRAVPGLLTLQPYSRN